jgi:hypothetical protein
VRELEGDLGIPQTTVSEILTEDLVTKSVVAKFVPRLLSQEQKEFHAEVAQDLLEITNNDPDFLAKVIIGDESWVYGCDPDTKPSLPSGSRLSLHIRRMCSKVAAMSRPC